MRKKISFILITALITMMSASITARADEVTYNPDDNSLTFSRDEWYGNENTHGVVDLEFAYGNGENAFEDYYDVDDHGNVTVYFRQGYTYDESQLSYNFYNGQGTNPEDITSSGQGTYFGTSADNSSYSDSISQSSNDMTYSSTPSNDTTYSTQSSAVTSQESSYTTPSGDDQAGSQGSQNNTASQTALFISSESSGQTPAAGAEQTMTAATTTTDDTSLSGSTTEPTAADNTGDAAPQIQTMSLEDLNSPSRRSLESNMSYSDFVTICSDVVTRIPEGNTLTINTTKWSSLDQHTMEAIASRPDMTVVINFMNDVKGYSVIIPAGYDVMSLLDSNGYCGFLYLQSVFGSTELQ